MIARPSSPTHAGLQVRRSLSLALGVIGIVIVLTAGGSVVITLATTAGIYAIAALGQQWTLGRTGLVSFGGAAFMALGAFITAAMVTASGWREFPLPLLASGIAGTILGAMVGLTAIRLRGIYLLIATLALQYLVSFGAQKYQGNNLAGLSVPRPSLAGLNLGGQRAMLIVVFVVLGLVSWWLWNVYRGAPGQAWQAIRENELAARGAGIPVVRWKLLAFAGSSGVTALAGSLYAYMVGVASYTSFDLSLAILIVTIVYVGGTGSMWGPLLGAIFVTLVPYVIQQIESGSSVYSGLGLWLLTNGASLATLIYAVALTAVLVWAQRGLAGIVGTATTYVGMQAARLLHLPLAESAGIADKPAAQETVSPRGGRGTALSARSLWGRRTALPNGRSMDGDRGGGGEPRNDQCLDVRGLRVQYWNGNVGVEDVALRVEPGEVVALLGRNGAGKTSTLRAISGFLPAERVQLGGSVRLWGVEMLGRTPFVMVRHGVALVPERDKVFPSLTVGDHVKMVRKRGARREGHGLTDLPGFEILAEFEHRKAGLLSGGQRQMLAIGLAALTEPRVLLIDELSLGLAPAVARDIMTRVRTLSDDTGAAVLMVEQDARAAVTIADVAYLLDRGRVVKDGRVAAVTEEELSTAYMGI